MLGELLSSTRKKDLHQAIYVYRPKFLFIVERFCPSFTITEKEEALDFILGQMEENDFTRLRKYDESKSKPETFLNRLARNLIIDYIRKYRGRKVLLAKIENLPKTHQQIFKLKFWDGYPDREVRQILAAKYDTEMTDDEFEQALGRVHAAITDLNMWKLVNDMKWQQGFENVDGLGDRVELGKVETPEEMIIQKEMDEQKKRAWSVMRKAISHLPAQDRLLIVAKFCENKSTVEVARMLNWNRKKVQRRLAAILDNLRKEMEAEGISEFTQWANGRADGKRIF